MEPREPAMMMRAKTVHVLIGLLLLSVLSPMAPVTLEGVDEPESTSARATTTWSGARILSSDYTIAAGDTLIIDAGATIMLDDNVRIYVEGELDVTGTAANPATITKSSGGTAHEGIQFNATSRGRGSVIQHLVIEHAEWAITVYDSNPELEDVFIDNADYVGIDLFDSADPIIRRLRVQGGGQDVASQSVNNRYGIGLSIGAGSTAFVFGATFDGLTTRGINMWGNSGGVVRDIEISNISAVGAGGWLSAGIWVEDSIALFDNISVDRSDNGIWVKHITETMSTRPTFRDVVVTNSMYRGVQIEQENRSNTNVPLNAFFNGLTVTGSGGPGAKTPGLCFHAIGMNTTGVDLRNVLSQDNVCNGLKAYMIDSATIMNNITVIDSGNPAALSSNDRSGVFIRSANWAPQISNLHVSGSAGHGIQLWKSSLQGHNWTSNDNAGVGLWVRESHPDVRDISLSDNGLNGLRVYDSSNVELYDLASARNGASAIFPKDGVGLYFEKANDLISSTKNVSCTRCSSVEDTWGGVRVKDSVDLQLHDLSVTDPGNGALAVDIDNSNLNFPGWVDIHGLSVQANRSGPIVQLSNTEARISSVSLSGSHNGLAWDGSGDARTSALSNTVFTGSNCLELTDLHLLVTADLDLSGCSGQINLRDSTINMSQTTQGTSVTFDMTGQPSTLRWVDSGPIGNLNVGVGSLVDEMWTMHIWAINQHGHGLPDAVINLSFDQFESDQTHTMPYSGHVVLGPFLAQRTDFVGSGPWTDHWVGCEYEGERFDSGSAQPLPTNRVHPYGSPLVMCQITLTNQAPLIVWSTPLDEEIFSSGAEVIFNASDSWDLDDDPITFTWTSNLDGQFGSTDMFSVNNGSANTLSDGLHDITLEICDTSSNCANESRQIELRNLPPVISIETDPVVAMDGVLRMFRTDSLEVNMSSTYDPEGDEVSCQVTVSYRTGPGPWFLCDVWNESFTDASDSITQFDYTITVTDGVNPAVNLVYAVELVNDLPHPEFTISRGGNTSAFTVTLDGSNSHDPEGDGIIARWWSDLVGELPDDGDGNELVWTGRLGAGSHQLTLALTDVRIEHQNVWATETMPLEVDNTPSVASISSHGDFSTNSSAMLAFESHGSGDQDMPCAGFSDPWIANHICESNLVPDPDNIAVRWDSSIVNGALGTDWSLATRLPAGLQTLTFTVDDGLNAPAVASITIDVEPSAPILILTSPIPGIEVSSDGAVLFDFRSSFDADGDEFWVNISSDLVEGLIVENGTTDYWYNDELPAGVHTLTFNLTDATGMTLLHTQILNVNPTGPHAVIGKLAEGMYIPPGDWLEFNGTGSYDADDDIIQYLWHQIDDGIMTEIANDADFTMWVRPGTATFTLTVRDSRGASDVAWVNVTVGASNPVLSNLDVSLKTLEADVSNTMIVSVRLLDADGTTQLEGAVNGRLLVAGKEHSFTLLDDGSGQDIIAGDGMYTGVLTTTVEADGEQWALLEVWASDGEMSSNVVKEQLKINQASGMSGIAGLLGSTGVLAIVAVMLVLALLGGLTVLRNKRRLAADLEMIESWGGGLGDGEGGFDLGEQERAPDLPDMDADAPPSMSDFGDSDD
jgi:hypothetical protein